MKGRQLLGHANVFCLKQVKQKKGPSFLVDGQTANKNELIGIASYFYLSIHLK